MQEDKKEIDEQENIGVINKENFEDESENEGLNKKFQIYARNYEIAVQEIFNYMNDGDFNVPDYQRNYIWTRSAAGRLIESILLGLPIPTLFLSTNDKSQKIDIIDGLQRIVSIYEFISEGSNNEKSVFKKPLTVVTDIPDWKGKKFNDLNEFDKKRIQRHRIPVVDIDFASAKPEVIRKIFERINTSGTKLSKQQIRKTVYWENEFIKKLYSTENLKITSNVKIAELAKKRDAVQELVLRIASKVWYDQIKNDVTISSSTLSTLIDIFLNKDEQNYAQEIVKIDFYFIAVEKCSLFLQPLTKENVPILFLEAFCLAYLKSQLDLSAIEGAKIISLYNKIYNENHTMDEWTSSTSSVLKLNKRVEFIIEEIEK